LRRFESVLLYSIL